MKRPLRPAKATLPVRCDAAPVDWTAPEALEEGEPDVDVPFSVMLPPVPAVDEGETLVLALAEEFLNAAKVLSPVALRDVSCIQGNKKLKYLRWVDHTDHTILAMLALCAVEPDGCRGIGDFVCESLVGNSLGVGSRNKAGPEAVVQRLARGGEGGLGDGVVLGPEAESNGVAHICADAIGLEDKLASLGANGNDVFLCESSASKGGGEDGREMHYDWI